MIGWPLHRTIVRKGPICRVPDGHRPDVNEEVPTIGAESYSQGPFVVIHDNEGDAPDAHSVLPNDCDEALGRLVQVEFPSLEAAEVELRAYAAAKGFSLKVRKGSDKWRKGVLVRKKYACGCWGGERHDESDSTRLWNCPFYVTVVRRGRRGTGKAPRQFVWAIAPHARNFTHAAHPFGADYAAHQMGARAMPEEVKKFIRGMRVDRILPVTVVGRVKERFPGVHVTPEMVTSLWRVCDQDSVDELDRLLGTESLRFRGQSHYDQKGTLDGICWLCLATKAATIQFHSVLLSDATYKTNRYQMPLILVTGTDNMGLTFLIGAGVVEYENKRSYEWFFETLCQLALQEYGVDLKKDVKIIVSDKDAAECEAIDKTFGPGKHILCLFHMFRNVDRNVAPLLRERFAPFLTSFRDAVFAKTEDDLNARVRDLYNEYPESEAYLSGHVFSVKEKFCYCYSKHLPTLGNSTTGRAELTNWLLKRRCRGGASLCQVICCSELVGNDYTEKRRWMAVKQRLRRSLVKDTLKRSLIDLLPPGDLRNKVLHEVAGIICSDFHIAYQRDDGDWACTCHFYENRLLPCRHIYAAKRAAVDIFTAADMHPMYQTYDLSSAGVSVTVASGNPTPVTVSAGHTSTPGLQASPERDESADTTIGDLKAMFCRSLGFAGVSRDCRQRLRRLLEEFNEEAVVKAKGQGVHSLPGSAKGRGRRSTKVQHNGERTAKRLRGRARVRAPSAKRQRTQQGAGHE